MIGEGLMKQRITNFGSAVLFGPNSPKGPMKLKLVHGAINDEQRLLRTWKLDGLPDREDFRELVDDVDREASEDAAHMAMGLQRYFLVAEDEDGTTLGSLTLRYSAEPQFGSLARFSDSEPATPQGQVAQAMRNTEGAYRMLIGSFGSVLESLNRRLAQQDQVVEQMLAGQTKLFQMLGEAGDKRFEREVWADTKRQESEAKLYREITELDRKDLMLKMAIERLAPLLPAVVASITGRGAPPTPTTAREEAAAAVLDSMSPEQFAKLGTIFTPEQMAGFGMFVDSLRKARGSEPGFTPPGTSSPDCKPSEEIATLAVARIQRELLPWVIEQMKDGEVGHPPIELNTPVKIFKTFVRALKKAEYEEFVNTDGPFNAVERVAFARLAVLFRVAPEGVPVPEMPAHIPSEPNVEALMKAFAKGMPGAAAETPKKG